MNLSGKYFEGYDGGDGFDEYWHLHFEDANKFRFYYNLKVDNGPHETSDRFQSKSWGTYTTTTGDSKIKLKVDDSFGNYRYIDLLKKSKKVEISFDSQKNKVTIGKMTLSHTDNPSYGENY